MGLRSYPCEGCEGRLCWASIVMVMVHDAQQSATPTPPACTGVSGSLQAGISRLSDNVTSLWSRMGEKESGSLQHKIYSHGQAVLENMSAEERLMRYIPKAATKVRWAAYL